MTSLYDCVEGTQGSLAVGTVAPSSPQPGDAWLNTAIPSWLVWDGAAWQSAGSGGASVSTGTTAPTTPTTGDLWLDTSMTPNVLKVYDGTTWLSLSAMDFATAAEVLAGTVTDKVIAPDTLQARVLTAPTVTPAQDAQHLVGLNGAGKIDPRFLTTQPTTFVGAIDITQPYTAPGTPPSVGSFGVIQTGGTADATWNPVGIVGPQQAGNLAIWDGAIFHVVEQQGAWLPLSGGTMTDAATVAFAVPTGAAPPLPSTRLDGVDPAKSSINRFTIDAGMLAPPAFAPITAIAGILSPNVGTVRMHGGPADQAYTATVTYQINGSGVNVAFTAPVALHDTIDAVANALVAACPSALVAVKTGPGAFNIELGTATSLDTLSIAIA